MAPISGVYKSVAGIGFCDDASWEGERRKNRSLPNRVSKLCKICRNSANLLFLSNCGEITGPKGPNVGRRE